MEITIPEWIIAACTTIGTIAALVWTAYQQKIHNIHEKNIETLNQCKQDKPK